MTEVDEDAQRLETFLARLDRLGLEDLRLLALPLPGPAERAAVHAEVDRVAADAGRSALVTDARHRSRSALITAYDRHQYDPTWAGLNWGRSMGTAKDRLSLTLAAEDAAVAAVMVDLLDEETIAALAEPFEHAAGMAGSTTSPSLDLGRQGGLGWAARIVFGGMVVVAFGIGVVQAVGAVVIAVIVGRRGSRRV